MATAFPLSPEEQVMGAIGSTGATPKGGFDITGALQEGYSPQEIVLIPFSFPSFVS